MKRLVPAGAFVFLVLPLAGCADRAVLLEFERPWWRLRQEVWEDVLVDRRRPAAGSARFLSILVSPVPAVALSVDPWGTLLARLEHVTHAETRGELWLKLYRLDTGAVFAAYRISEAPEEGAAAAFVRQDLLWVSDGRKVYAVRPGRKPRELFEGSRLVVSRDGQRIAVSAASGKSGLTIRDAKEKQLAFVERSLLPLDFRYDAKRLLVVDERGVLCVVGIPEATVVAFQPASGRDVRIVDARFFPDGRYVAALAASEGRLEVFTGLATDYYSRGLAAGAAGGRLVKALELPAETEGAEIIAANLEASGWWLHVLARSAAVSRVLCIEPFRQRVETLHEFAAAAVAAAPLK